MVIMLFKDNRLRARTSLDFYVLLLKFISQDAEKDFVDQKSLLLVNKS